MDNQDYIDVLVSINSQQYQVSIDKSDKFQDLIDHFKQEKGLPAIKNQLFILTSIDKNGQKVMYKLSQQIGDLKSHENGNMQLLITWRENEQVQIKIQFQEKLYLRMVNEQDKIENLIKDLKKQLQISDRDDLLVQIYSQSQAKQIRMEQKVKGLIQRYGEQIHLIVVAKYNQSSIKVDIGQSLIKNSKLKPLFLEQKNSDQQINNQFNAVQQRQIQILIQMDDLGSTITKQFIVPNSYSFADIRSQIDFEFAKHFDEWDQQGNQQLIIIDADSQGKNIFTKTSQPFKRIFGNDCRRRIFSVSRVYPGG